MVHLPLFTLASCQDAVSARPVLVVKIKGRSLVNSRSQLDAICQTCQVLENILLKYLIGPQALSSIL